MHFLIANLQSYQYVTSTSIHNQNRIYIILNIIMPFRTACFSQSNCTFSPVILNIWCLMKEKNSQSWKAQGIISGWLVLINSAICKSSTNHMSHLHQPTFNPPKEPSLPSPMGAKKMTLDIHHMLRPLPHWQVQRLIGGKEIISAALMANAAANLTYIIHEASESEQ